MNYHGYDDIHMPRVTLWYSPTIWKQKKWLLLPISAILLVGYIGYDGYNDMSVETLWYTATIWQ